MSIAIASVPAFPIRPAVTPPPPPPPPAEQQDQTVSKTAPQRAAVDTSVRPLVDVAGLTTVQEANAPAAGKPEAKSNAQPDQATLNSSDCSDCEDNEPGQLTDDEKAEVAKLKSVDQQVRAHEAAHASAGGGYAGAASFSYQTGPDGKRYAVAGHVPIDVSPIAGDPAATIEKMDTVRRAALAPSDPSSADRSVAANAAKQKAEAQAELSKERQEALQEAFNGPDQGDKAAPQPDAAPNTAPDKTPDVGLPATGDTAGGQAAAPDSADRTTLPGHTAADAHHAGFRPFRPAADFGDNDHDGDRDNPFAGHDNDGIGGPAPAGTDASRSPFDTTAGLQPDHSRAAFARATNAYSAQTSRAAFDLPGVL